METPSIPTKKKHENFFNKSSSTYLNQILQNFCDFRGNHLSNPVKNS